MLIAEFKLAHTLHQIFSLDTRYNKLLSKQMGETALENGKASAFIHEPCKFGSCSTLAFCCLQFYLCFRV